MIQHLLFLFIYIFWLNLMLDFVNKWQSNLWSRIKMNSSNEFVEIFVCLNCEHLSNVFCCLLFFLCATVFDVVNFKNMLIKSAIANLNKLIRFFNTHEFEYEKWIFEFK